MLESLEPTWIFKQLTLLTVTYCQVASGTQKLQVQHFWVRRHTKGVNRWINIAFLMRYDCDWRDSWSSTYIWYQPPLASNYCNVILLCQQLTTMCTLYQVYVYLPIIHYFNGCHVCHVPYALCIYW